MTSWAHVEDNSKVEPKWAHVDDIPETKGEIEDLCDRIDKAVEMKHFSMDRFGFSYKDRDAANFIFAVSKMQQCMGKISQCSCDMMDSSNVVDNEMIEREFGKILFYMEMACAAVGRDLSDVKDETIDICRGVQKLD